MESLLIFGSKILDVKIIGEQSIPCISVRTLKGEGLYPECIQKEETCIMTSWGNLIDIHCYDDISLGYIDLDQLITMLVDYLSSPRLFSTQKSYSDFAYNAKHFLQHFASRGITFTPALSNEVIFGTSCRDCLYPMLAEEGQRLRDRKANGLVKEIPSKKLFNYFVLDVSHNLIKIGVTEDVERRMSAFRTSNPGELRLLKAVVGGYQEEKDLHVMFNHLRVGREWFKADIEIYNYIDTL